MPPSIEEWVKANQARVSGEPDDDEHDRRFTVRVDLATYVQIDLLASRFGMSKTKCAQEILTNAASQAYIQAGFTFDELDEGIRAEL